MKNKPLIQNTIDVLITISAFLLICYIYKGQERVTQNDGKGVDGYYYYQAIEQITEGKTHIVGEPPFVNRIGFHYLVAYFTSFTNGDILNSAFYINLIGIFITSILLLFWLAPYIKHRWIKLFLVLTYMLTWHVPLRLNFFVPMATDPWGAVFFLLALLSLRKIKTEFTAARSFIFPTIIFSLIISIGVLFRESNYIIVLSLFLISNPFYKTDFKLNKAYDYNYLTATTKNIIRILFNKKIKIFLLPIVLPIITTKIALSSISYTNILNYSYPKALIKWLYQKSFPEFIVGTFIAYGVLLVILPSYYKTIKAFFKQKEELLFVLITGILFGYIAGGDTERILFMSTFPIIYILIGICIERLHYSRAKWWLYPLFFFHLFAIRLFWNAPKHPNEYSSLPIPFFGLIGDKFNYLLLYSHHGNIYLNTILLIQYLILTFITYRITTYYKQRI